jgi:hypothetical protein
VRERSADTPHLREKSSHVTIVTVCRDNFDDLKLTLNSIAAQTLSPRRHIIVDSSGEPAARDIRALATKNGSEYFWSPPLGIYPAMKFGLEKARDEEWVWFLNSGDYLANTESLLTVEEEIQAHEHSGSRAWLIGKVIVTTPLGPRTTPHLIDSQRFVHGLQTGRLGIAHPAMIAQKSMLESVGAFAPSSTIAEDYRIALSLIREGLNPAPVSAALAVYDQSGYSAQHPFETLWAKVKSRVEIGGNSQAYREPFRVVAALVRALVKRLASGFRISLLYQAIGMPLVPPPKSTSHFCGDSDFSWPDCCKAYLNGDKRPPSGR